MVLPSRSASLAAFLPGNAASPGRRPPAVPARYPHCPQDAHPISGLAFAESRPMRTTVGVEQDVQTAASAL